MADENMVEQKQPQNPADQIAIDAGLPEQPTNVPGPSTFENQQQTEVSKEQNDRLKKKQEFMKRMTGKKPSIAEAQYALMQDIEKEEKEQEITDIDTQLEQEAEQAKINKALETYKETKQKYSERGLNFQVDENFEALIAEREQKKEADKQQAIDALNEEILKKRNEEALMQQQEVEQEKAIIKKQENIAEARNQRQIERAEEQRKQQEQDQQEVETTNERVKNIDSGRFWKNLSTKDKIIAAISVALSGMGSGLTGQANQAIAMINKHIDADLKDQKLSYDEKLAKKQETYRRQIENLKAQGAQLKNQNMMLQNAKLLQSMEQERAKLVTEQLARQKIARGDKIELFELPEEKRKEAGDLRKEYNTELNRLKTRELVGRYQTMVQAGNAPESEKAAADLNLIFSYMKILDPQSVVREGEFATASNAGSVPQRLIAQYNKVVNGGRLSDAQRRAFVNQATTVMKSKMQQQESVNKRYSDIAKGSGIPSNAVIEDFSKVFSKREQLIQKQMDRLGSKANRNQIEKTIDTMIEKGQLSGKEYGR